MAARTLTGGVVFDGKITSIGDGAFRDAAQAVSIPETVTRIGNYAFYGCTKQDSVSFSDSLKQIGAHAFEGSLLTGASFASGLEEIGDDAFYLSFVGNDMDSVTLPSTVCRTGCNSLQETNCQGESFIIYSSTNTVDGVTWKIVDGVLTVTGTGDETVVNGPWSCMASRFSSLVIGEETFANTGAQAVILPAGCRRIERRAFADCERLEYVFLPNGMEFIAEDAFEHSDVILIYQ